MDSRIEVVVYLTQISLAVYPCGGLLADEEPAHRSKCMVLGNVASFPLLDGTRSMQLSAISSTPNRTPCGPLLRFGRRITSIERLGGSPLVPRLTRLLSFHGSTAVRGMCRAWGERRDIHIKHKFNFWREEATNTTN